MRIKTATSPVLLVAVVLFPAFCAYGQGRAPRYAPSRPAVSPYLNLLRRDTGPVPNYHTLVRPQLQQQAINQQQRAINQQQQSLVQAQQRGLQRVQAGLLEIRQPQGSPTGTGGGYMDYSHFYSFSRTSAPRR
ncbi:MAG: hypothetical protein WD894_11795 [Pirellulales bacterium]